MNNLQNRDTKFNLFHAKNPAAETAGHLKLDICFQCHSRLSGILPNCSRPEERFWIHPPEADKSQNDRNKELPQRTKGVRFMKNKERRSRRRDSRRILFYRGKGFPSDFDKLLNLERSEGVCGCCL